ncbi:hypothetical protein [Tenacibaculum maritimum]|uniref:hypothetical protein n=1 Tax=Tenacibaculum maritimum TaxID=107401 RepID=UPI0012E4158E|nr:hypothetical protein [Tenacibaculum maritimum]MCD9562033.1 hypothetical protein [Tenacibaculum maritimum]MCD9565117.1 hypothetical protein [Tenacibaculum maritimum]MCD9579090.1 hypothetical protein [Tenacibaculum maritimum]MCD9583119.1 hypothetical protein [Tenacibaculum maritimum]MCD9595944.1 hypothetical protein [Tenacibaculum maritimum]
MAFLTKIKEPLFWKNVTRIAIPFFIIVTLISLFMNSWKAIFSFSLHEINELNFSNGKWKSFWGYKIIFSLLYGIWQTAKNTK